MPSFKKHWFLALLLLALVVGYVWATELGWFSEISWLKWSIVACTMFLMTWPMEFGRIASTLEKPLAPTISCVLNLGLAPLLAWPLSFLLGELLGPGLILAAAVPSTLASAAVWTRRAGGNDSIAIVVTIVTNSVCFIATPAWVYVLIGIEIPQQVFKSTILNLFLFVVIPMVFGQLFRLNKNSANWSTANKTYLAVAAQLGILAIVFLGSVNMGLRLSANDVNVLEMNLLFLCIVLVAGLHLTILMIGVYSGRMLGLAREDQIAIGFSSSQKTLMVGLSTGISMGLNIIPIVAYHAVQLIVDTLIADHYREKLRTSDSTSNENELDTSGK